VTATRTRTVLAVAAAVLLGVALRLPFLSDPLEPDEAGYLLVAHQWHLLDPHLYGQLWVDRPPLLLLLFQLADGWGPHGVRLVGVVAVVVLATAAGVAGFLLTSRRGAVMAALVAGTLASSYAIGGQEVDGELLGIPLVMVSCALTLLALRHPHSGLWLGALAGLSGTAALLVKQNLADGLVFAFVLVAATWWAERRRNAARILLGGTAGILLTLVATVAWAQASGVGLGPLAYTVYGFRAAADGVISGGDVSRPLQRAVLLAIVALLSGIAALLTAVARHTRHGGPRAWALAGMALYGVAGILAGGSYWTHYLIELVPVLALAAALAAGWRLVVGVVVAAVAATGVGIALGARTDAPEATAITIGHFLHQAARPDDGVVVTYGHANIVEVSGLSTPYRYLWSLPMRVRDPQLDGLVALLNSPRAPAWVVEYDDFNAWGIDVSGHLADAIRSHYRVAARVCGRQVWLDKDRTRLLSRGPRGPCGDR
jgi:4-amino-4-deoxy-L-arabinose transferase-like glycosyltransferase